MWRASVLLTFGTLCVLVATASLGKMSDNCSSFDASSIPELCPVPVGPPVVPPGYFLPPNEFLDAPSPHYNQPAGHNLGTNEGRLVPFLRKIASRADCLKTLVDSALFFLDGNVSAANAVADLAVTGRESFACFAAKAPQDAGLIPLVQDAAPSAPLQSVKEAVSLVLDRAYNVADAIRQPSNSWVRQRLGWIAVSGEDDLPYRPVNVVSSKYPQYDLVVSVPGNWSVSHSIDVYTRYIICQTRGNVEIPRGTNRTLPPPVQPTLADDAIVFLYMHGMDSRAEEAEQMCDALIAAGRRDGKNYALIAMDLPTSGYASHVDHTQISPLAEIGEAKWDVFLPDFTDYGEHRTPLVDFVEGFVEGFVEALERQGTGLGARLAALAGGSLGGSLALRFGRRPGLPWLRRIVAWSPASIWTSLADGADILRHQGPRATWLNAGGDPSKIPETPERRAEFMAAVFDKPTSPVDPANPLMWYRDNWPCIQTMIVADRLDRLEMYDGVFRLWHWRLACEQLIYSHQQASAAANAPLLYLQDVVPMALLCGVDDAWPFADICPTTQQVSHRMVNTPGYALYVKDTGHSIHNERPNFLAGVFVNFLKEASTEK